MHKIPYITRTGKKQVRPSVELAMALQGQGEGFCLACGESQVSEPDAEKQVCDSCGEHKVYGIESLLHLNLVR